MNKSKLVETLGTEREAWEALLAEVTRHGMTEPGLAGNWSAKDIVTHITWYERETATMIEERALVRSDLWLLPQDERNIPIYEANKDRQLEEILAEADNVFERLVRAVKSLSDAELIDASYFREMPEGWMPWKVIASNSYEHYHQHIPGIRVWLDEVGRDL
jgi:hypothetical protein